MAKASKAGTATGLGLAHPYNQKCTKCVDYMSDAFLWPNLCAFMTSMDNIQADQRDGTISCSHKDIKQCLEICSTYNVFLIHPTTSYRTIAQLFGAMGMKTDFNNLSFCGLKPNIWIKLHVQCRNTKILYWIEFFMQVGHPKLCMTKDVAT